MKKYFNKPYDDKGTIASSGDVIIELLEYLKQDEFYSDLYVVRGEDGTVES